MSTPEPTPDPWVMLARYTLGKITAEEYANYLESRLDADDPTGQIVIDYLRKTEDSSA